MCTSESPEYASLVSWLRFFQRQEAFVALIKEFVRTDKGRQSIHGGVECGYSDFQDARSGTILQLDTYGSAERKLQGKVSQSLQLDRAAAKELVVIIRSTFDIR